MRVAVLVDGEYFIRRYRKCYGPTSDPAEVASELFKMCMAHATEHKGELYRIFFYDCAPLSKRVHYPITNQSLDFSKTDLYKFRVGLHRELVKKRKMALRLGRLADKTSGWRITSRAQKQLLKGERTIDQLADEDFKYEVSQKGVDMKIGLDISSLSFKKLVSKIVLISGDADFVPAAKHARREGIDFVLDPMWQQIPDDLMLHIDGLNSKAKKPQY